MPQTATQPDWLPTNKALTLTGSIAAFYTLFSTFEIQTDFFGLPWDAVRIAASIVLGLICAWFVPDRPNQPK